MEQKNIYNYIGPFTISSETVIVTDPYINRLTTKVEKIPPLNGKSIIIRDVLNGVYEAYHHQVENGSIVGLVCIHNTYSLNELKNGDKNGKEIKPYGVVSSNMSSSVVVVDKRYYGDNEFIYLNLNKESYFDNIKLLNVLDDLPYSDEIKCIIKTKIKYSIKRNKLITGADILEIIGPAPAWRGFINIENNMWNVDILEKIHRSYTNASVIKGGVATLAGSGFLNLTCYKDKQGNVYAFYISMLPNEGSIEKLLRTEDVVDFL